MAGVVFYEGFSELDGQKIIGIATSSSKNSKTGDLTQTWILKEDQHPMEAIHSGQDSSICGDCPLRGLMQKIDGELRNKYRGCYVAVQHAPANIWKAYQNGKYEYLNDSNKSYFLNSGLRYGSYGDPTAIPWDSWYGIEEACTSKIRAGYTHQWKEKRFQKWRFHIMASTHSIEENKLAHSMGWRTFRTSMDSDEITNNEIVCPASAEMGKAKTCEECGACNGNYSESSTRKSIFIIGHGGRAKLSGMNKVHSLS